MTLLPDTIMSSTIDAEMEELHEGTVVIVDQSGEVEEEKEVNEQGEEEEEDEDDGEDSMVETTIVVEGDVEDDGDVEGDVMTADGEGEGEGDDGAVEETGDEQVMIGRFLLEHGFSKPVQQFLCNIVSLICTYLLCPYCIVELLPYIEVLAFNCLLR
jgi:hypothetical protein